MSLNKVLLAMLRYQQEHNEALRPVLIGKTGTGKTTLANELAAEMKLKYVFSLFSQQLPEDIGGWPNPNAKSERLKFLLMEEIMDTIEEPCLYLLDELDKVRPDVMATLLTLLYNKRIRGKKLHPQTVLMGAMQPVNPSMWLADETGKAVSARLTFLPVPYRWKYIEEKFSITLPHLHEREKKAKIELPVMEATPRTMESTLSFLRSTHGMNLCKSDKQMVLYGTMTKQDADVIEATLNQTSAWIDPIATSQIDPMETVNALDVHSLTQHIGALVTEGKMTKEAWTAALKKVWIEGTEEDAKAYLQNLFDHLKAKCDASPTKQCEVFGSTEADEIVKATNEAAEYVAKIWNEASKKKVKK